MIDMTLPAYQYVAIETRWLKFEIMRKTDRTAQWRVSSLRHGTVLGEVRWFPHWRQYAFFPAPNTAFNPECLDDLSAFIANRMREKRDARRKA